MTLLRRGRGVEHEYVLNTDPQLALDQNVERRRLIATAIEGLKQVGFLFPNVSWAPKGEDGNFEYESSIYNLWPFKTRPPSVGKNGMRIYDDALHLEISTPVYSTSFEAVVYGKVSECLAFLASQEAKKSTGHPVYSYTSNISLRKSNSSIFEAVACGTHGNIMISRRTFNTSKLKEAERALFPYLVTRIVLFGSGGYVPYMVDENGQKIIGVSSRDSAEAHGSTLVGKDICFVISPRSHFVNCKMSEDTTVKRGLFNLRDEPHASRDEYWRFHDINWEGVRSDVQIYMRDLLHTFVIAAFEKGYLKDGPILRDPLGDLRRLSMDMGLDWKVKLIDGGMVDAVDDILIGYYLKKIEEMLEGEKASNEDWAALELLSAFLSEVAERDLGRLVYCLDWVTKLSLIQACDNEKEGLAVCNQFCLIDDSILSYMGNNDSLQGDSLFEPNESMSKIAEWVSEATPQSIRHAVREGCSKPPSSTREAKRVQVLMEKSNESLKANWAFVVGEDESEKNFPDPLG